MKKILAAVLLAVSLNASAGQADDVAKRLTETYVAAADWLTGQQGPDGAWKMGPPGQQMASPSYTGLILTALANAPMDSLYFARTSFGALARAVRMRPV